MNSKENKMENTMLSGLGIAAVVNLLAIMTGVLVLTWFLNTERIQDAGIGYGVMVVTVAATMLSSAAAIMKVKQNILLVSTLTGIINFLILIAINALFFEGEYEGAGVTALLIVGASLCVAFLCANRKNKTKKRKRKKWNR